ncbi:MAG: hypothetical protein HQ485_06270 [Acidobacteria bacterium]|jgi:hypothetical protein|nr:hypothetical protein [Acidobacteriota bacterium]
MRLSGFLPGMGRRVVVAIGVVGMLMVSHPALAQDAAAAGQTAQPEAPDPFKFSAASPVMVLLSIKQGQEAVFESGFGQMKAGLAAATKPEFQEQSRSLQLMKVDASPPVGQPALYIMFLDSPVVGVSYDFTQIFYYGGAFNVETPEARKKVDDIYAKFTTSLESRNIWPIVKK